MFLGYGLCLIVIEGVGVCGNFMVYKASGNLFYAFSL